MGMGVGWRLGPLSDSLGAGKGGARYVVRTAQWPAPPRPSATAAATRPRRARRRGRAPARDQAAPGGGGGEGGASELLHDLHDVLVPQHVVLPDLLRVVLHGAAPDPRVLEGLDHVAVQLVAELLDGRVGGQDDGLVVVGDLPLGLGVDADEVQVVPDAVQQPVQVPLVLGGDGAVVRDAVDDVQLLRDSAGCRRDVLEGGGVWHKASVSEGRGGDRGLNGGGGGLAGTPLLLGSSNGPHRRRAEILKRKSSWYRRRRSKIVPVSLKHWKGRREGGGTPPPPAVHCAGVGHAGQGRRVSSGSGPVLRAAERYPPHSSPGLRLAGGPLPPVRLGLRALPSSLGTSRAGTLQRGRCGRFRTARAQRGHSANYYGVYPGNTPCKPPPYRGMHDPFKTASGVQTSGPRDPWLPVVENS